MQTMDPPGSSSNNSERGSHNGFGNHNKKNGTKVKNGTNNIIETVVYEEQLEQFREMAMIEANVRVYETTGFDPAEYNNQQMSETNNTARSRPRPLEFFYSPAPTPQPKLPDPRRVQHNQPYTASLSYRISGLSLSSPAHTTPTSALMSASNVLPMVPQEASLPPRRANRRYNEHPRSSAVSEVCDGVVVRLPDGTIVDDTIIEESEEEIKKEESDGRSLSLQPQIDRLSSTIKAQTREEDSSHILVDCMGCGCRLRVHRLASLVNCTHCLTVNPSILPEEERQN